MNWWMPNNFENKASVLEQRAQVIKAVRAFFDDQGFVEVETPVLQTMPGADTHIHGFRVENGQYLQNSPEFSMKKLLVAGMPRIYQICKVFRREERTKRHNPEFTMIEWYRAGADYTAIMEDCVALLQACADEYRYNGQVCDPHKEWIRISVADAFEQYAGIGLAAVLKDTEAFKAVAGVRVTDEDGWDDVFHAVMAEKIEPYLGAEVPCILYDYPADMAALSRKKPEDPRWAERFELYVCGVELANAFSELTDAKEQRARFEAEMALKEELYGERYPLDEDFLAALEHGMPESAGIALGIDRLVMLALGAEDIRDVIVEL